MSDVFHELSQSLGDEERKALLKRISESLNFRNDVEEKHLSQGPGQGGAQASHRPGYCPPGLVPALSALAASELLRENKVDGIYRAETYIAAASYSAEGSRVYRLRYAGSLSSFR